MTVPDTEALNRALAERTENEDTSRVGFLRLGTVGGDSLFGVPVPSLREASESFFRDWMQA